MRKLSRRLLSVLLSISLLLSLFIGVHAVPGEKNVEPVATQEESACGQMSTVETSVEVAEAAAVVQSSDPQLVKDGASLQAGDQIIIAALDYDYALSTTQNTGNRGQAAVTKSGDVLTAFTDAQVITLEQGTADGSFAFQVGSGQYLYAPSSSANNLKTTTSVIANGSWSVEVDAATGAASIVAVGDATRNVMRYNSTSGLFSCYAATNSQKDICIYQLGGSFSSEPDPDCDHSYSGYVTTSATCESSGVRTYICSGCSHRYTETVAATGHRYLAGLCATCGGADPAYVDADKTYYLFGYIEGTNYGCEEDSDNLGDYQFDASGSCTATFLADSYVAVKAVSKSTSALTWHMTDSWQGYDVNTVTLYDTNTLGENANKLYIPGGIRVRFTVITNLDGTLTLTYRQLPCNHDYGRTTTTEFTCTTGGVITHTCTDCGHYYTETVAATGHEISCTVTNATCYTYAAYELYCVNCGEGQTLYADELAAQMLPSVPDGMDAELFTYGTMYRYRDNGIFSSYEPGLTDCALTDTTLVEGGSNTIYYVSSWPVGFDTSNELYSRYDNIGSKITATETETTKTVITSDEVVGYLYYHWCYEGYPYTVAQGDDTYNRFHAYYSTKSPSEADKNDASDDSYRFDDSTACDDSVWYFYVPVYGQSYTTYRKLFTYQGWGPWSDWSTTRATASATRQVETATGYHFDYAVLAEHSYENGVCTVCGMRSPDCSHSYTAKVITAAGCETEGLQICTCTLCGDQYSEVIPIAGHSYSGTVTAPTCIAQGYTTYTCTACGSSYKGSYTAATGHIYTSKVTTAATCTTAGVRTFTCTGCTSSYTERISATGHSYGTGVITTTPSCLSNGIKTYTCTSCGSTMTETIAATDHSYSNGTCSVCGAADPNYEAVAAEYYLFGYINGYNYACEEDYTNLGIYKFVDGKLTTTFTQDSYVAVKTGDNQNWYMTDGWQGDTVTSVTLYDTTTLFAADKMYVPGNVEVTFTLTENSDGSLTLSYTTAAAEVVTPTIGLKYPTLTFEDVIVLNVYYSASNLDSVVEMGLITYSEKVESYGVDTAEAVVPGYYWSESDGFYYSSTEGIPAKCLGDTIHFAVYCKLTDGSYTYTALVGYSPKTYAYNQLKTGSTEMKPLVVAMLNYGAAAQTYFGYNTAALVNADMTADQLALIDAYSATMVDAVTQPDSTKLGTMVNNGGYSRRYPTISFEGAFCINYYFLPSATVSGNITMYVWNYADYAAAPTLSKSNATQAITMELTDSGEYLAVVEGIAAKDLDKGTYVSFCYTDGTTDYCSGVIGYSIGAYCVSQATKTGTLADLAAATAVYGYYAKQLFYVQA